MKIVGKILAVLYSILLTFVIFGFSVLILSTHLLKPSYYKEVLKSVDFTEIKASDLGIESENDETLSETLSKELVNYGIDKDVANNIVNNDQIKEVVGDLMGEVVEYQINKEKVPSLDKQEIEKILDNEDVKKVIDNKLSKEDLDKVVDEVNVMLKDYFKEGVKDGNE